MRKEACRVAAQEQLVIHTRPPKPAARSRLLIGEFGPSDSALAAARGWRLRRPAADRDAARCASRCLCSGARPSTRYALECKASNLIGKSRGVGNPLKVNGYRPRWR